MADFKDGVVVVPEIIQVGQVRYRPLFPEMCIPLTEAEFKRMLASVESEGKILVPVVVDEGFDDGTVGVIDGINRLLIAEELDFSESQVPQDVQVGLNRKTKEALCRSLNDQRRHRSKEQTDAFRAERRKRVQEARDAGKSLRTIAEEEGIPLTTAARDASAVPRGTADTKPEPESDSKTGQNGSVKNNGQAKEEKPAAKVTGKDGKTHPASKPKKTKPAEPAAPKLAPGTVPDVDRDALGIPLTDATRPYFEHVGLFADIRSLVQKAANLVNELAQSKAGVHFRGETMVEFRDGTTRYRSPELDQVLSDLKATQPFSSVCPYCHKNGKIDKKCPACLGTNIVPERALEKCPREDAEAVRDLGRREVAV